MSRFRMITENNDLAILMWELGHYRICDACNGMGFGILMPFFVRVPCPCCYDSPRPGFHPFVSHN